MKKKGFTLVELLAVIIILAVIALIATPIVLNVIEDSRESSRQSSIALYADAVRLKVSEDWYKNGSYPTIDSAYLESIPTQGEKVTCEEVHYSEVFETILHKCTVGRNTKEYYYAANKLFEDPLDESYKSIYASLSGEEEEPEIDLATTLISQYNESNTVGLLKDDTGYYYKGTSAEVANNFVWFAGHLWRVISIDNNNNLTMITQQPVTAISPASSGWKTQAAYENSNINRWLNNEENGVFYKNLTVEDKGKIINTTFNVGTNINISAVKTTQKVGLLDITQYTKAGGLDSFLDIKDSMWLGNRYNTSTVHDLSYIYGNGNLGNYNPIYPSGIRPVIKISDLIFTKGKGTLDDPYRGSSKTTSTSDIKVGEYISIPTTGTDCGEDNRCLFRVVSKDNNSIKITLNGLLPSSSQFGSKDTYVSGNTIDTRVTIFANNIDDKYKYSENDTTFGIGTYANGANYTVVQDTKYTGAVGLPVAGEMFTGNDIDVTTLEKTFVNIDTIENPTVARDYWIMNAYSTSSTRYVAINGDLDYVTPTYSSGVRPVLFLNQGLTFTGGEGTAEHPFMLD